MRVISGKYRGRVINIPKDDRIRPTMDRIKETVIKLPVDTDGNPDWQFMENYIKALPYGDRLEG